MHCKAFVSLCEPSLKDRSPLERIGSLELSDATAAIISLMIKTFKKVLVSQSSP